MSRDTTRKKQADGGSAAAPEAGARGGTGAGADGGAPHASIDPAIAALNYEEAVKELEGLVASIEQGDVGLEASLLSYRRGEQLVRHCKTLLDRAESTVRTLSVAEFEREVEQSERPPSR